MEIATKVTKAARLVSLKPTNDSEAATKDTSPQPVVKNRRRSLRSNHAIKLPDRSALHYRRMDQLFFRDAGDTGDVIRIGNLHLQPVHSSPNVYVIDDFLKPSEVAHLTKMIEKKPRFHKSFVGEDSHVESSQRTSTFLSIAKQQDSTISAIETKASSLLGCFSTQNVEPLQLVRYLPGQFFGVHHDLGDWNEETDTIELPPKSLFARRRLVTIFCYLNSVSSGGATNFPALDVRVQPLPGRAVLFSNIRQDGLPEGKTLHAGEPPLGSTKYGLNIWVCEE